MNEIGIVTLTNLEILSSSAPYAHVQVIDAWPGGSCMPAELEHGMKVT